MNRAFLTRTTDRLIDRFAAGDDQQGRAALQEIFSAIANTEDGALVLDAVVARVADAPPHAGAWLALLGGAIIENERHDPSTLATALAAPLKHALTRAEPFLCRLEDAAQERGDDDDVVDDDSDDDSDDDRDDVTGLVPRATMAALAGVDPDGHAALSSLNTWYRPVVATWSRHVASISDAQRDVGLVELLRRFDGTVMGATWMTTLVSALIDAPLVLLFPELGGEAWSLRATGVVDNGQLSVLLDEAVRDPLARMGFDPADDDVLAVMKGDGPQEGDGEFACGFHLYPWQAMDPATGRARTGVFAWRAPGGIGTHSLPADFRPGDLTPLNDGVRVVLVTGKEGPSPFAGGARILPATRSFSSLRAHLSDVRRLTGDEAAGWRREIGHQVAAAEKGSAD